MSDEIETTNEIAADSRKTFFFTWENGNLYITLDVPPRELVDEFVEALTEKYGKDALVEGLFNENGYVVRNEPGDVDEPSQQRRMTTDMGYGLCDFSISENGDNIIIAPDDDGLSRVSQWKHGVQAYFDPEADTIKLRPARKGEESLDLQVSPAGTKFFSIPWPEGFSIYLESTFWKRNRWRR